MHVHVSRALERLHLGTDLTLSNVVLPSILVMEPYSCPTELMSPGTQFGRSILSNNIHEVKDLMH